MNSAITWNQLGLVILALVFGPPMVVFAAAALATIRGATRCPTCDRKLVRRSGKLRQYETRHYCPYHDDRE